MIRFVNRAQLYKEVWSNPLTKLSPVYNLSTYEIKKLCNHFFIPLPKAGHWSKIAFGKVVEIPSLPSYCKCKLKVRKSSLNKKTQPLVLKKVEKKLLPNILVKKNLTNPHPITVKTREGLKKSQTDEYGMKRPWGGGFDLRVSKVNERRALLIIDTLCKWFDKKNIKIYQPFKGNITTEVLIDEQSIRIKIEEKSTLTAKVLKETWGSYEYNTREYTPTEKLSLVIDNYCWGCDIRKIWRDGKTSKVEENLNAFVSALFQHAEHEKQRKIRRKAEDLERERRHKVKKYDEACEKLEKEMLADLKKQSTYLKDSRELRAYIDEVKSLAKEQYKGITYTVELTDWINWAEGYVKELNPLSKGLPRYKKATELVKLEDIE